MTSVISVGKLQGCRVCDCIPDHYEYLIWAEKAGLLKFSKIVVETIQEHAGYRAQQQHFYEEVDPYINDHCEPSHQELNFEDDVPF